MTSILSIPLLLLPSAALSSSDNNFCGSSWADASSSCEERQHCPNASDEECTAVPGSICFADTLCDASMGHGAKAAVAGLAYLLDIPYEDVKNRKFCGSWWAVAQETCSMATFCGDNEDKCKDIDFSACYETQCHVQDLASAEFGDDWKELLSGEDSGEDSDGKPVILDEKDVRRNNFCGTTWADATSNCGTWCLGEDTDCPGNLKCFGDTGCYYDEDLKPSLSPTGSPPTTSAPISASDPINNQFCGETWALAIENCTPQTNCKDNDDCPGTEACHGFLPGCVLSDMLKEAETGATAEEATELIFRPHDPTNHYFCGESWTDAVDNCSLETHCPDNQCPNGKSCFQFIELGDCDAYELWMNQSPEPTPAPTTFTESPTVAVTNDPTKQPTKEPIIEPTIAPVPVVSGLCARDEEHLKEIYRTAEKCSNIDPCPDDLTCIQSIDFQSVIGTSTLRPTPNPSRETIMPSSKAPSRKFFTLAPIPGTQPVTESPVASDSFEQPETYTLPPHATDSHSNTPTYSDSIDIKELKFYCAVSASELEESCDSAIECTPHVECPEINQGCIYFDCDKWANNTEESMEPNNTTNNTDTSNFVPQCPKDFDGFASSKDLGCRVYYNCRNGKVVGETNTCDDGLKYDTKREMCWYADEVDSECRGPPLDTSEPTSTPSQRPTFDTSKMVCPPNHVGSISNESFECKLYYECKNGIAGSVSTCEDEFRYDIVRQMCWYRDEVNDHCYGPPLGESPYESSNPQNEQNDKEDEINGILYKCRAGYTGWASHNACKQYYWCNDGVMERDILKCLDTLLFDVSYGTCKHASEVECDESYSTQRNETPSFSAEEESDSKVSDTASTYAWPEDDASITTVYNKSPDDNIGDWNSRMQAYLDNSGARFKLEIVWVPYIVVILYNLIL